MAGYYRLDKHIDIKNEGCRGNSAFFVGFLYIEVKIDCISSKVCLQQMLLVIIELYVLYAMTLITPLKSIVCEIKKDLFIQVARTAIIILITKSVS